MKNLFHIITIITSISLSAQNNSISTDRWLEPDLYWSEKDSIHQSAERLLDPYHPLLQNLEDWKGLIISIK